MPKAKWFEVKGMSKHKQMPGMTYRIVAQDERQAVLECTYLCPYCMRKATVRSVAYPADYDRLETGDFYDALACSECGKVADIRFWQAMKVEGGSSHEQICNVS